MGLKINGRTRYYDMDEETQYNPWKIGQILYSQWSSFSWSPTYVKSQREINPNHIIEGVRARMKEVLKFNETTLKKERSDLVEIENNLLRSPNDPNLISNRERLSRSISILENEIPDIYKKMNRISVEPFISPRSNMRGYKISF